MPGFQVRLSVFGFRVQGSGSQGHGCGCRVSGLVLGLEGARRALRLRHGRRERVCDGAHLAQRPLVGLGLLGLRRGLAAFGYGGRENMLEAEAGG